MLTIAFLAVVGHMALTEDSAREGLNKILAQYGHGINKLKAEVKKKYLANALYWKRRPLEEDAIRYAAEDVVHLLEVERKMATLLDVRRKEVLVRSRQAADSQRFASVGRAEAICESGNRLSGPRHLFLMFFRFSGNI